MHKFQLFVMVCQEVEVSYRYMGKGKLAHSGKAPGGGGFFNSKGTWGCAAHKGMLFWTSSPAKGILFGLFGNFSRV